MRILKYLRRSSAYLSVTTEVVCVPSKDYGIMVRIDRNNMPTCTIARPDDKTRACTYMQSRCGVV